MLHDASVVDEIEEKVSDLKAVSVDMGMDLLMDDMLCEELDMEVSVTCIKQ